MYSNFLASSWVTILAMTQTINLFSIGMQRFWLGQIAATKCQTLLLVISLNTIAVHPLGTLLTIHQIVTAWNELADFRTLPGFSIVLVYRKRYSIPTSKVNRPIVVQVTSIKASAVIFVGTKAIKWQNNILNIGGSLNTVLAIMRTCEWEVVWLFYSRLKSTGKYLLCYNSLLCLLPAWNHSFHSI